ncbi:Asp23/Gls24 family envelope stress response protein [Corynebacterium sp. H128]|uniref:Asp23/Gls24 family envelope stress response protein n=1 Tax=Corynebacterium sp. H128 TaxID=3133427 RepID=UPI0030984B21
MSVVVTERALTKIVEAAVDSVPGTVSFSTGMGRLTGRAFPRCDVQLDDTATAMSVEVFIAVTWPSPVNEVAAAVQRTIIEHVRVLAGLKVDTCNVVVGPVISTSRRIDREDLQLPALVPIPVKIRGQR